MHAEQQVDEANPGLFVNFKLKSADLRDGLVVFSCSPIHATYLYSVDFLSSNSYAMSSHTIYIRNQSSKAQTYCVYLEDTYILDSDKNVLVVPKVDPGGFCLFTIDGGYYVWAKLSRTSETVFEKVDIGSSVGLSETNGKPTITRTNGTPNQDCFAITVEESFTGMARALSLMPVCSGN